VAICGVVCLQVKLCDPHLSALEVSFSRRGAVQIYVYLYLNINIMRILLDSHFEIPVCFQSFCNMFLNGSCFNAPISLHSVVGVTLVSNQVSSSVKEHRKPSGERRVEVEAGPRHVIMTVVDVGVCVMPSPE